MPLSIFVIIALFLPGIQCLSQHNAAFDINNEDSLPEINKQCTISDTTLLNILNLLLNAQNYAIKPNYSNPETYLASRANLQCGSYSRSIYSALARDPPALLEDDDNCVKVLADMDSLIRNITEDIKSIVGAIIIDPVYYELKIKQLQEEIFRLNGLIDDLIQQQNQELADLKKELEDQQQCFLDLVNQRIEEIEAFRAKYQGKLARLIAANIKLAAYDRADADFIEMNNNEHLEFIMEKAYGQLYFENLATFTEGLPQSSLRIRAYQAWYDLIEYNNHFTQQTIVIPNRLINDEVKRLGSSAPPNLRALQANINSKIQPVVTDLGNLVRNGGDISGIIDFWSPQRRTLLGFCFEDILEDVVNAAYSGSSANRPNVSKFVFALRWNMHKAIGLRTLINKFTTDQDKLFIARKVKGAYDSFFAGPDHPRIEAEQILISLKSTFKPQIRGVIWGYSCTLLSASYPGEYLKATTQYYHSSTHGYVFTQSGGATTDEARFKFAPVEDDNSLTVTFEPENLNTFRGLSTYRRNIFDFYVSNSAGVGGRWRVEPQGTNQIRLYHMSRVGYLHVGSGFLPGPTGMREVILNSQATTNALMTLSCTE